MFVVTVATQGTWGTGTPSVDVLGVGTYRPVLHEGPGLGDSDGVGVRDGVGSSGTRGTTSVSVLSVPTGVLTAQVSKLQPVPDGDDDDPFYVCPPSRP